MNTKREEKLEDKLFKLQDDLKNVRKELHTCKQKNRDLEKGRKSYKEKTREQEVAITRLSDELKKKR
jgi:chromosome segregation ATPase